MEEDLRAACVSGREREAAARGLAIYGPEIFSYLYAILHDETEVDEAFSMFCADLWQALPRFRWECSFRTLAYLLARRALADLARERVRRRREITLSSAEEELAARVRTETREYLRTEVKERVARLRAGLDPDDQSLLILRVDRKLSWPEIARVFLDEEPGVEELARMAATLRKRFERIKETLRQRAHV